MFSYIYIPCYNAHAAFEKKIASNKDETSKATINMIAESHAPLARIRIAALQQQ